MDDDKLGVGFISSRKKVICGSGSILLQFVLIVRWIVLKISCLKCSQIILITMILYVVANSICFFLATDAIHNRPLHQMDMMIRFWWNNILGL